MSEAIERLRLRAQQPVHIRRLTEAQGLQVVADVRAITPLASMVARAGLDPASEADRNLVLDFIADYGTWLSHVDKEAEKPRTELWHATGDLFPELEAQREPGKGKRRQTLRNVAPETIDGQRVVVVPKGFERRPGFKRDVSASLGNVYVSSPDNDVESVRRYMARKYPVRTRVLTLGLVGDVWRFAQLGRLETIDKVNEKDDRVFDQLLVDAYDTLEVARADAVAAVDTLAAGDAGDVDALHAACARAKWVAPAEVARIAKAVTLYQARPSEAAKRNLVNELRWFAERVRRAEAAKAAYAGAHQRAVEEHRRSFEERRRVVGLAAAMREYVEAARTDALDAYRASRRALATAATRAATVAETAIPRVPAATFAPVPKRVDVDYRPATIADLLEGQVRMIAAAAGVQVEPNTRAEEQEIRQRIAAYGFRSDMDRLLPQGLRAHQAGALDSFFEALEARADGDPDWQAILVESLAG